MQKMCRDQGGLKNLLSCHPVGVSSLLNDFERQLMMKGLILTEAVRLSTLYVHGE